MNVILHNFIFINTFLSFSKQFSGYNESVCAKDPYDEDDREADAVYDSVDNRLDERRQVYRERKLQEQLAAYRKERPKIQMMFAHLKQDLAQVRYCLQSCTRIVYFLFLL